MLAIDWDIVLRMCNSWLDRIVDADRAKPTHAERQKAMNQIRTDLEHLTSEEESEILWLVATWRHTRGYLLSDGANGCGTADRDSTRH